MSLSSPLLVRFSLSTYYTLCHVSVYFLHKSKMADERFVGFRHAVLGCTLFVHIGPPRTLYSSQQRMREEIVNCCATVTLFTR